jgi:hypothetical protein
MTAHRTLTTDLPCLRCGYNLRTLSTAASCPECNYPAVLTLWGGLPMVDTRRRRRLLAAGVAALALALLWFTVLASSNPGYTVAFQDPATRFIPVATLSAAAMVLLALPQTAHDGTPLFRPSRWFILASAPAAPLSLLLWERAYAWVPASEFDHAQGYLYLPLLAVAPAILLAHHMLTRLVRPLGLGVFRISLRIVTVAWWLITAYATVVLSAVAPPLDGLWRTAPRFHFGPHRLVEILEVVIYAAGMVAVFAYIAGIALLAFLAAALAISQPRDEPTPDSPLPGDLTESPGQPATHLGPRPRTL